MLGFIVVASLLWLPTKASAMVDDYPPGSYQQSCRDLRMRGDRLEGQCQRTDGGWNHTSLRAVERCIGDIDNIDGQLTCNRNVARPGGNYAQSCRDIRMRYNTLYARCQNRDGRWVDTALDGFLQCRAGVENVDGQLRCGGGGNDWDRRRDHDHDGDHDRDRDRDRRPIPAGSYAQSCRDIQTRGPGLWAVCQNIDGGWEETSLDAVDRCVGDIVNDNGHLECTRRGGRLVPRGSYVETCREVYVRGDTLRARCQTADGGWRWSQLNDWDDCAGGIVNDNGQLICRRRRY